MTSLSLVVRMRKVLVTLSCFLVTVQWTRPAMGHTLPYSGYYQQQGANDLPLSYEDDQEEPDNADQEEHDNAARTSPDYPDYQMAQLSPADVQMMADMEEDLYRTQQDKALQEQVWLEPALSGMRYPAHSADPVDSSYPAPAAYPADYPGQYDLQPKPYQTSAVLNKKDIEHLQYLSADPADMSRNQEISFRKTPLVTDKPVESTAKALTAERRGMKEEAIFRPGSVRDREYRGRKKRSIPPFISERKVHI